MFVGLLKGTTPAQFEQLRQQFLEKVNAMFPAKKRSKRPSLPQKGIDRDKYPFLFSSDTQCIYSRVPASVVKVVKVTP